MRGSDLAGAGHRERLDVAGRRADRLAAFPDWVDWTQKLGDAVIAKNWEHLTMKKAANDRGAFVNARKFEIDAVLTQLGESLSHALFRAGALQGQTPRDAWFVNGSAATTTEAAQKANASGIPMVIASGREFFYVEQLAATTAIANREIAELYG